MPESTTSPLPRKGADLMMFMKLTTITVLVLLALFARGVKPTIIIIIFIFPLWLLAEKVMADTTSNSLWKSIEEREDFSRLPLAEDINKMKGAKKGQKVKQAILEGRIKDQVYYTLKNEYNLSEEDIDILADDPNSMIHKIDNKKLIEYLNRARDLNDLKKPDGEDQMDLFSEEEKEPSSGKNDKFEAKIGSALAELEKIHYVEEER